MRDVFTLERFLLRKRDDGGKVSPLEVVQFIEREHLAIPGNLHESFRELARIEPRDIDPAILLETIAPACAIERGHRYCRMMDRQAPVTACIPCAHGSPAGCSYASEGTKLDLRIDATSRDNPRLRRALDVLKVTTKPSDMHALLDLLDALEGAPRDRLEDTIIDTARARLAKARGQDKE